MRKTSTNCGEAMNPSQKVFARDGASSVVPDKPPDLKWGRNGKSRTKYIAVRLLGLAKKRNVIVNEGIFFEKKSERRDTHRDRCYYPIGSGWRSRWSRRTRGGSRRTATTGTPRLRAGDDGGGGIIHWGNRGRGGFDTWLRGCIYVRIWTQRLRRSRHVSVVAGIRPTSVPWR